MTKLRLNLLADASLPELDIAFPPPFHLTYYHNLDELNHTLPHHNLLLCRSTLKVNQALLKHTNLDYVLTASSGRDHLDEAYLTSQNIQILDAKGSNAWAVVEYVLASLSYIEVIKDIHPKTVGIIGFGEVGSRLYRSLASLRYTLFTYDPLQPGPNHIELMQLAKCDLVCIHANLHHTPPYPSFHLITKDFLKKQGTQSVIINASRGEIVDEQSLLHYHQGLYCTDVFANEPKINREVVQHATLCTPHIAGHTIEAKIDAVRQLSKTLHKQLNLTPPNFSAHTPLKTQQENLLSIYNPITETQVLKSSIDLKATFLTLRQAHYRHAILA